MAFTREDMAAYEKQPQTQVADNASPFEGATPAKTASAADIATAKNSTQPNADDSAVNNTDPSSDADESDLDAQGDGASDANADSSTASADGSGESDTNADDDDQGGNEVQPNQNQPKKGSAAERIQELNDLMSGYKEFGKLKENEVKELRAELARLKTLTDKNPNAAAPSSEAPLAVKETGDPMPDLSDPDVNFDADKLRVKTQKWIQQQIQNGTQAAVKALTGQTAAEKLRTTFETNAYKFAEGHKDWDTVVVKNQVLIDNQLAPVAAIALARSELGPDIMYYMGQNPGVAVRIAKLPPDQQLEEIGEIKAEIKAQKKAAATTAQPNNGTKQTPAPAANKGKQKSHTQAPPPPNPTKGASRADPRE